MSKYKYDKIYLHVKMQIWQKYNINGLFGKSSRIGLDFPLDHNHMVHLSKAHINVIPLQPNSYGRNKKIFMVFFFHLAVL